MDARGIEKGGATMTYEYKLTDIVGQEITIWLDNYGYFWMKEAMDNDRNITYIRVEFNDGSSVEQRKREQ